MEKLNTALAKKLLNAEPLDSVEAVRRQGNAYAVNNANQLIALSMSEKNIDGLMLGQECTALEHLYLGYNQKLSKLEFEQGHSFPNLEHLYLNNCALEGTLRIPAGCNQLKQLYVQQNKLETLAFEDTCKRLELLDASDNGMSNLQMPSGFFNLKYVYLLNNQIGLLPECFVGMRHLDIVLLSGNPLSNVPPDVIGSGNTHNSARDLLAYLDSVLGQKTEFLHEAKMILVGNPMVGKSSIRVKLKDPKAPLPGPEDRTAALDVEFYHLEKLPVELTGLEQPIDFLLKIWDFGGQGRYREIQQLFCSRKSLYLYVTSYDDKAEKEDYIDLDYWLSMVNAYSFDPDEKVASPVIYVLNKIDGGDPGINETTVKEKFPNLAKFAKISCEKYEGFDVLIKHLRTSLPMVSRDVFNNRYSVSWFHVKRRLEGLAEHHIPYGDFLNICQDEGLELDQSETWLRVLDRIGSVIYTGNFKDKEEWVILKPEWVKDAIIKVIDYPFMHNDGVLKKEYFDAIWEEYPNPQDRENLIKLMLHPKYRLAFAVQSSEGETEYMVPSALFNKAKPSLVKHPFLEAAADYNFEFRFSPFIPAGLVCKLIVDLNEQTNRLYIWKNGCVLQDILTNAYVCLEENWRGGKLCLQLFKDGKGAFFQKIVSVLNTIVQDIKASKFLNQLEFKEWMEYEGTYLEKEVLKKIGKYPFEGPDGLDENGLKKKKIFFSYSQKDEKYLDQFKTQLAALRRRGLIEDWDDSKIKAGEEWEEATRQELAEADIIILLISADFLATERLWDIEIKTAMQRHERKEARVIPVYIRSCDWNGLSFSKLEGLPSNDKPVSSYTDRDQAWQLVVEGIKSIL